MKKQTQAASPLTREENAENIRKCLIYLREELQKVPLPFSTNLVEIAIDGIEDEISALFRKKH